MIRVLFSILVLVRGCSGTINAWQYYADNGGEIVLRCPLSNQAKWYGVFGHQYTNGLDVLSSLPAQLRLRLSVETDESYNLKIHKVEQYDVGQYNCTDGITSVHVILNIKEPPSAVTIEEAIAGNIVADENSTIEVNCKSTGGQPPPLMSLVWKNEILTASSTHALKHTFKPTRMDDLSIVTCTSNHSMLQKQITTSSKFLLNLGPYNVTFDPPTIEYEGHNKTFVCRSRGSRPKATFEWFLDGAPIKNWLTKTHESLNQDQTFEVISMITTTVTRDLNRKDILCRSSNMANPGGVSQRQSITVYYPPSTKFVYSNATEAVKARQFQCIPNGNPVLYTYAPWEHRSFQNDHIRYLQGDNHGYLTLPELAENIRYQDSGIYICSVDNSIVDVHGVLIQTGQMNFFSLAPPKIGLSSKNMFLGFIGQNVLLSVEVISWSPITSFRWYSDSVSASTELTHADKYEKRISESNLKSMFLDVNITLSGFEIYLTVKDMHTEDSGTYILVVENDQGRTETSVVLNEYIQSTPTEVKSVAAIVGCTLGVFIIAVVTTLVITDETESEYADISEIRVNGGRSYVNPQYGNTEQGNATSMAHVKSLELNDELKDKNDGFTIRTKSQDNATDIDQRYVALPEVKRYSPCTTMELFEETEEKCIGDSKI